VNIRRQPIRPLPVILPPLADELLSSWIDRHAAFIGVSGRRLLRYYLILCSPTPCAVPNIKSAA